MADIKYLAHEELIQYNDRLNERNKKRLKYHGEIDISVSPFSFDSIAADRDVKVGDVYQLVNTTDPDVDSVTIDDVEYSVGDWVISTSEVDKAGTGVTIKKLGSSTSRHQFSVAEDKLPDTSKFKEDHVVLLTEDEMDTTDPDNPVIAHRKGLWRYDLANDIWVFLNESEMLDVDYMLKGSNTEVYAGAEDKLVDSDYLDKVFKNYSRYINPLLNPAITVFDTKAELEAVDMDALTSGKSYIYVVKNDESPTKDIDTGTARITPYSGMIVQNWTGYLNFKNTLKLYDTNYIYVKQSGDIYLKYKTCAEAVGEQFEDFFVTVFNNNQKMYQSILFTSKTGNKFEICDDAGTLYITSTNGGLACMASCQDIKLAKLTSNVYVCSTVEERDGKPTRQMKLIGDIKSLINHPLEFVSEFPSAGAREYPTDWRLFMYVPTDPDEVRGLYYYDPDEDGFFPVHIYEDTDLDIDFMFDSTLTETYAGEEEHVVDSAYLDTTLKDLARYINPLLNPKIVVLEDKAAREALDLTTLDDGTEYIYVVKSDESDTKDINTGRFRVWKYEIGNWTSGPTSDACKCDADTKVYVPAAQENEYKYYGTVAEIMAGDKPNVFSDVMMIIDETVPMPTFGNQNISVSAQNGTNALSFFLCDDGKYNITSTGSRSSIYDAFCKPVMVASKGTNVYVCDAVEGKDGKPVRKLKLVGDIKDIIGKGFNIVEDLPDLDDPSQVPTRDMAYWLKENVTNADGSVKYYSGLYIFDSDSAAISHPYAEDALDFVPSFDGTKYLPDTDPEHKDPTNSGDEGEFVSSKYLYDSFEDFSRWLKPLHHPTIQILADHDALDAIDVTTLDADKSYVYIVKDDETVDPTTVGNITIRTSDYFTIPDGGSTKLDYPSTATDEIYKNVSGNLYTKLSTFAEAKDSGETFTNLVIKCHDAVGGNATALRIVADVGTSIKVGFDAGTSDYYVEAVDGECAATKATIEDAEVSTYGTNVYVCNAFDQDASGDPERKIELVGDISSLVEGKYKIATTLPDLTDTSAVPHEDTVFLLTKTQTVDDDPDGDVMYTPGEYLYDLANGVYKYLDDMHMLYKGELELDALNRTDWNDLIPCHIGDTYKLTTVGDVNSVTIDDIIYNVGDFIIVTNDVMSADDVTVEKITASASGGIEIVSKLPEIGEADKLYAIQKTREYDYTDVKWYILNDPTIHTIKSDGIYELATDTLVVAIKNVTSEADIDAVCTETTALDASIQDQYICNYTKTYAVGDTESFWCTQHGVPFEPGATGWDEHVESASKLQLYMYNTISSTWHQIYPCESGAITYVDDITSVVEPNVNTIYATDGMSHIKYHRLSDTQIANGSTVSANMVKIENATSSSYIPYTVLAEKSETIDTLYGFVPVIEADADANTFVTYTKNGLPFACSFETFTKGDPIKLYIYNGREFEVIYPTDELEGAVSQIEVTSTDYGLITTAQHPTITYNKNTIYKITDIDNADAPIAMLNGMNIADRNAVIDITTYPEDGDAELDAVNRNGIYRTEEEIDRYTECKYYDVDGVTSEIDDEGVKVVATGEIIVWSSMADQALLPGRITELNLTEKTEADISALTIAIYKDALSATPNEFRCSKAVSITPDEKAKSYELGFYSDFNKKWEIIYPPKEQELEFEAEDIDFYDTDVWAPLKP